VLALGLRFHLRHGDRVRAHSHPHTRGPLTDGDDVAATGSVSSSDESASCDSVVVSELTKLGFISALGCTLDSLEESLPPSASALGFLSDRLIIGWERFDMAGIKEILVKKD